jgi:pimeloyl-ACP methyl ester carboxylesterase
MTSMPIRLRLCVASITLCASSIATADQPPPVNVSLDLYAKPGQLVDIGNGRHLNLRCTGTGKTTVMLESGAVADSMAFYKVQPAIAAFARVCSYDRAGYGFSDGGAVADYLSGSAKDLHALIDAAHIATPVILVGHSLGSDIVRRYADNYSSDVAAIVLIDPPPQDLKYFSAARKQENEQETQSMMAMLDACSKGATAKKLDDPPPELKACLRGDNPQYSAQLNAAQHATKIKPAFWKALGDALRAGKALDMQAVPASEHRGATPLLILQPDAPFRDEKPDDRSVLEAARINTHRAIAATSTRSEIIPVAHSSHDVQIDQPAAVVDAIKKAIAQSSTKK